MSYVRDLFAEIRIVATQMSKDTVPSVLSNIVSQIYTYLNYSDVELTMHSKMCPSTQFCAD